MKIKTPSKRPAQAHGMIDVDGNTLRVRFDRFGIDEYKTFLKVKSLPEYQLNFDDQSETFEVTAPSRFASLLGVEAPIAKPQGIEIFGPEDVFHGIRMDDQVAVVEMALAMKRFACWSDCGLGKTVVELEFSRHVVHLTGGKVLIFTLNGIVDQYFSMAEEFYGSALQLVKLRSREEMKEWCSQPGPGIAVVNYEKMNHGRDDQVVNELRHLAGVVLDEASRLKTGGGKQKWALIKSCKGIEYKLSATATPAPNNIAEFASQASFLEKMRSDNEIIWTFFLRDPKTHRWTVKKHARAAFFEWMSSWSIYIRDPRKYGWRKDQPDIPKPIVYRHDLPMTDEQQVAYQRFSTAPDGQLSLFETRSTNTIQRGKLSQIAKGFIYKKSGKGNTQKGSRAFERIHSVKPGFIADLANREHKDGLQVLVWTVFDAESVILSEAMRALGLEHSVLNGRSTKFEREILLGRFVQGDLPVLVSRADMLGYGRNFQNCGSMIFSGWTDGYEGYYQAIRRAYRYLQTRHLRVHLPVVGELEGDMLENILNKEREHEAGIEEMEKNYIAARQRLTA